MTTSDKHSFIDKIFIRFINYKPIIGIGLLLFGFPLLYLLRDGARLAPSSSLFTKAFIVLTLALIAPLSFKRKLFFSNNKLLLITIIFHFLAFLYIAILRNPEVGPAQEYIYLSVNLIFLFLISFVPISTIENKGFLKFVLYLTCLQNTGVVLYALLSGTFVLGQRFNLAIVTDAGQVEGITNTHIFAKGAFVGVIVVVTYLRFKLKDAPKLVVYAALISSLAVFVMTMSMTTIVSLVIFFFFLFLLTPKVKIITSVTKQFKKPITILFLIGLLSLIIRYYNKNKAMIEQVFMLIWMRVEGIVNTLRYSDADVTSVKIATDISAGTRIEQFNYVYENLLGDLETFNILNLLFGRGYFVIYVDSPLIQTFLDMGLVGFTLFLAWHIYAFILVKKYFNHNMSPVLFFISALFFMVSITNLTQGLPYGYQNWVFMIFITRFLKNFTPETTLSVQDKPS